MIPSDKGREPPYWEIVSGDETTMVREVLRWPMLYGFAYSQSAQWGDFQHYSDEQLRERVEQGWSEWLLADKSPQPEDWVMAAKTYLWRRPLDTQWAEDWRERMGPFWVLRVRCNSDDWAWIYHQRARMGMPVIVRLLQFLPAHRVGSALVVEIFPQWGYNDQAPVADWKILCDLLDKYGDVVLHPEHWLFPRWRAAIVCLSFDARLLGGGASMLARRKRQKATIEKACGWLRISPRTILRGYDSAWVKYVQALEKPPRNLIEWDRMVQEFEKKGRKGWLERANELVANAQAKSRPPA